MLWPNPYNLAGIAHDQRDDPMQRTRLTLARPFPDPSICLHGLLENARRARANMSMHIDLHGSPKFQLDGCAARPILASTCMPSFESLRVTAISTRALAR